MTSLRFKALEVAFSRQPVLVNPPSAKISDFFGSYVFDYEKMKEFLSKEALTSVLEARLHGARIDRHMADQIANGLKTWAVSLGATHYTHWFQPLTGATAEKHDAFFECTSGGGVVERFSGDSLVQQEPDASSFPSGGIRSTFEARGYTAWDPSSPAFVLSSGEGKTLCIPTIFVSYTGESLDYKTPLLKALAALDRAAVEVCSYFDRNITKVNATLGIEQEYFLVDLALYNARPDLILTGRTVFGHQSARDQQLEDHYFGVIPERVYAFMLDLEIECFKLGIPLKTRHNEVAPSQFECAPIFEEINLAIDHNQLLMELMEKVSRKHNLKVLLHEKPYAGINGSGKHNNWSMVTDTGKNLLSPGKTPKNNLMFLTFFAAVIKAVHEHAELLRASIASINNDHRLGANEAPPAIMSIFIGSQLTEVLGEIESSRVTNAKKKDLPGALGLNIPKIPQILLDNTDRNRTSPFAFTGNKFELRAVGSSANSASPMTVISSIVAAQLILFKKECDQLIKKGEKKEVALLKTVRNYIKESKPVLFEGNGYSTEWEEEAERRGLQNVKTTPKALDALYSEKTELLYTKLNIFSKRELHARHEILLETYIKKLQIEARVINDMVNNQIIPVSVTYLNVLIQNVKGLKELSLGEQTYRSQLALIEEISSHLSETKKNADVMLEERKAANKLEDTRERAVAYDERVKTCFEQIRYHVDKLELLVDDYLWPLPKFRELLFIK